MSYHGLLPQMQSLVQIVLVLLAAVSWLDLCLDGARVSSPTSDCAAAVRDGEQLTIQQ